MATDKRRELIQSAISEGRPVKYRLYGLLPQAQSEVQFILESILLRLNRENWIVPFYTIIKELALNGAKANFKRILFQETGLRLDHPEEYIEGIRMMRQRMNDRWALEYAEKAKEREMFVETIFNYSEGTLNILVKNNQPMSREEDIRARARLQKAQTFESIADFYMSNFDESEGAGMGIALVVMLLKAENLPSKAFTLQTNENQETVARLQIPLSGQPLMREGFYDGALLHSILSPFENDEAVIQLFG